MHDGPDIAAIGALMGDPSRAGVLTALLADRALSATELADLAGVTRPTISGHLDKLLAAGLVAVEPQGRHRYFRLADRDVALAVEALMGVASRTGATRRLGPADPALRKARLCYDHLAGELGVWICEQLVTSGAVVAGPDGWSVTEAPPFDALGIDLSELRAGRRTIARTCLDWSERRHHLAGALGAAILRRLVALSWVRRTDTRALLLDPHGEAEVRRAFAPPQPYGPRR